MFFHNTYDDVNGNSPVRPAVLKSQKMSAVPSPSTLDANALKSSISKSADHSYMRTTFYLPKHLHKKLKVVAAKSERDMSGIVEELLASWLEAEDV